MAYTLQLYSTASIDVFETLHGSTTSASSLTNNNPVTAAQNGNAFSWHGWGDGPRVGLTFGTPNASVTVNDSDSVLTSDPVSADTNTVTDQLLAQTTEIDGTTYTANDETVRWETPPATFVRTEYTVTLYDADGHSYTMAGISIVTGWNTSVVGVTFIGAAPAAGTTLYYIAGQSVFNDTDPSVPLSSVPCFSAETLILTEAGERAAGDIRPGDRIWTRDAGFQPVLWIGNRTLGQKALTLRPSLRPIRIRAGALGHGHPARDLVVSPQHRILLRSVIAERMFGTAEVLVPAKKLLSLEGVDVASDLATITYVHLLFDRHQIVMSEGQESESLFTGPEALKSLSIEAREEILTLFPELRQGINPVDPARMLVAGKQAKQLIERHIRNRKPVVA